MNKRHARIGRFFALCFLIGVGLLMIGLIGYGYYENYDLVISQSTLVSSHNYVALGVPDDKFYNIMYMKVYTNASNAWDPDNQNNTDPSPQYKVYSSHDNGPVVLFYGSTQTCPKIQSSCYSANLSYNNQWSSEYSSFDFHRDNSTIFVQNNSNQNVLVNYSVSQSPPVPIAIVLIICLAAGIIGFRLGWFGMILFGIDMWKRVGYRIGTDN